jgi:hypothetical protein
MERTVALFEVQYHGILPEGRRKSVKLLTQYSRSQDRDLNPEPLKYEAEVETTRKKLLLGSAICRLHTLEREGGELFNMVL